MTSIKENLFTITQRIREYEMKYHRTPGSVCLLAASKSQPIEKITEAYCAGQHCFGENYLQEALDKIQSLADKSIEWHFIGPVQSNKTRKIAGHFDWVQSVTTMKIAKRLNDQRPVELPPLNICIEVNISQEPSKAGMNIANVDNILSLADYCLRLPRLKLRGLMAIPAEQKTLLEQRREFNKLYTVWDSLRQQGLSFDSLSMGMSGDFEAAIAEGATLVRIGSAIFGQRKSFIVHG